MSQSEKITFGATIETPSAQLSSHLNPLPASTPIKSLTPYIRDAPPTPLSSLSTESRDPASPFGDVDFYKNGAEVKTATELKTAGDVYVHDIESQRHLGLARTQSSLAKNDSMWPSKKSQKAKAKQQKCAKSWNPMAAWSKKQRTYASILIALLIIGAAVGIGVGVSKAVGGGVTTMHGGTKPIGTAGDEKKQ